MVGATLSAAPSVRIAKSRQFSMGLINKGTTAAEMSPLLLCPKKSGVIVIYSSCDDELKNQI